jgi:MFS family permease
MNGVATNNIVIESSPSTERLGYIAAANVLITLPFGCAPPLGGWLADRFSFRLLFSLSAALYLIGGALLAILVRDPRRRQQT